MKSKNRVVSVVAALSLLIILAIIAGFSLAVWDTESSVTEFFAMAFPRKDVIVAEKQVIEIADGSISDFEDNNTDREKAEAYDEAPKISEISDGFAPSTLEDTGKNVKNLAEDGGITALVNAKDSEGEAADTEAAGENAEDTTDDLAKKTEENEEREPLVITAEISGIGKVVRAGSTDESEETILAPSHSDEYVNVNMDPLADYPLPYTQVDRSYFDDALFIGDSRVAGLAMNSGTNATFYAVTSFQLYRYKTFKVVQTPEGKVPIFDAMPYDRFTKIYIKVGLNELGSVTDEPFLEAYTSFINELRVMQPRAIIYIQAILPVTQVKSQTDRVHCNENIAKRNANLKSFAEVMKCYFVDVGPYFADETGALKAETTADGIHMYGRYMPEWIDALSKQAVVWPPEN